jgi:hypothetical protein
MYFRSFSVLSLRADGNYHKVNQRVKLNVTSLSKISQKVSELLSIEQMAMESSYWVLPTGILKTNDFEGKSHKDRCAPEFTSSTSKDSRQKA